MIGIYHREIMTEAVGDYFSVQALNEIILANLDLDSLKYQIGYPHYHFDDNTFSEGESYIDSQRRLVRTCLSSGRVADARAAFGRLTHVAQDFYAHSNYVSLWVAQFKEREGFHPDPDLIDPLDEGLRSSPSLQSGKVNYLVEAIYLIPLLNQLVLPLLPLDSHARMNLDNPDRPNFEYAFAAAKKRTVFEYQKTVRPLTQAELSTFTNR